MNIKNTLIVSALTAFAIAGDCPAATTQQMHKLFNDPAYRATIEVPALTRQNQMWANIWDRGHTEIIVPAYAVEVIELNIMYRQKPSKNPRNKEASNHVEDKAPLYVSTAIIPLRSLNKQEAESLACLLNGYTP